MWKPQEKQACIRNWLPRSKLLKLLGFGNILKIKLQKMYLIIEY